MVSKGHEIADHGWRWRNHVFFSGPDEEAEDIRKEIRKMQEITGLDNAPAGWFIGSRFLSQKTSRAKVPFSFPFLARVPLFMRHQG
jgi:peptidoglycan/xylan/chitin deacetylase (PgdA/CDA1 family)